MLGAGDERAAAKHLCATVGARFAARVPLEFADREREKAIEGVGPGLASVATGAIGYSAGKAVGGRVGAIAGGLAGSHAMRAVVQAFARGPVRRYTPVQAVWAMMNIVLMFIANSGSVMYVSRDVSTAISFCQPEREADVRAAAASVHIPKGKYEFLTEIVPFLPSGSILSDAAREGGGAALGYAGRRAVEGLSRGPGNVTEAGRKRREMAAGAAEFVGSLGGSMVAGRLWEWASGDSRRARLADRTLGLLQIPVVGRCLLEGLQYTHPTPVPALMQFVHKHDLSVSRLVEMAEAWSEWPLPRVVDGAVVEVAAGDAYPSPFAGAGESPGGAVAAAGDGGGGAA